MLDKSTIKILLFCLWIPILAVWAFIDFIPSPDIVSQISKTHAYLLGAYPSVKVAR